MGLFGTLFRKRLTPELEARLQHLVRKCEGGLNERNVSQLEREIKEINEEYKADSYVSAVLHYRQQLKKQQDYDDFLAGLRGVKGAK